MSDDQNESKKDFEMISDSQTIYDLWSEDERAEADAKILKKDQSNEVDE